MTRCAWCGRGMLGVPAYWLTADPGNRRPVCRRCGKWWAWLVNTPPEAEWSRPRNATIRPKA